MAPPYVLSRIVAGLDRVRVYAITAVCTDCDVALPNRFVPVTVTRSVAPTSAGVTAYVGVAAPAMSVHAAPAASQCCHWCVSAGAFVHVPGAAVRLWPWTAVPVIVGGPATVGTNCSPACRT